MSGDEVVIREVSVEGSFTFEEAMRALQEQALKDREADLVAKDPAGGRLRGNHAVSDDEEAPE